MTATRQSTRRWGWLLLVLPVSAATLETFIDPDYIDDAPRVRDIEYPEWFKISFLDLREDLDDALAAGKWGIVVYFGQQHCAYCEALMEVNFGTEQDIVEYTRRHFDVIAIDIWGSREVTDMDGQTLLESEYAEREQTNFTPSLVFYDQQGEQALRLRGYYPPYTFRAALEYVVDGYYRTESLRDYLARADPPPKFDLGDLNEEDFFEPPPYALDRSRIPAQKPLAVFFEQADCHACDILHTHPLSDTVTRELLKGYNVVQLDMWSDTPVLRPDGRRSNAQQWARALGLFYAPVIVIFDERGRELIRVDSVVRLCRLQGVLEYVLSKGYKRFPTFQRWREERQRQGSGADS